MGPNALTFYRLAQRLKSLGLPGLAAGAASVGNRFHRTHVSMDAELGEDVELGYGGLGIVIAAGVKVGARSVISQEVTLDVRPGMDGVPLIGREVFVGVGAKVLGPVTVGDRAKIGANALVLEDVPADAVVVGIPAHSTGR